jgi:hypothetical protein
LELRIYTLRTQIFPMLPLHDNPSSWHHGTDEGTAQRGALKDWDRDRPTTCFVFYTSCLSAWKRCPSSVSAVSLSLSWSGFG